MKFSGTLQEQMKSRFGISVDKKEKYNLDYNQGLLNYKQEILNQALIGRKGYQKYIQKLSLREGEIAFFDFVAKGTSQMYISRLLKHHLKGFYFLQLEEDDRKEKELDILSFYSKEEKNESAIFDNYYILEAILTAPTPSLQGFDKYGNPLFAKETRTRKSIQCFQAVQSGIFDYFKTYLKLCSELDDLENKNLDELFLTLVYNISILDQDFLNLKVEDPFFNRTTNLIDLL